MDYEISMSREVALVMNGYLNLTAAQRSEFIAYLNSYNQGGQAERDRIQKVDVGPITTGLCPCCQR